MVTLESVLQGVEDFTPTHRRENLLFHSPVYHYRSNEQFARSDRHFANAASRGGNYKREVDTPMLTFGLLEAALPASIACLLRGSQQPGLIIGESIHDTRSRTAQDIAEGDHNLILAPRIMLKHVLRFF